MYINVSSVFAVGFHNSGYLVFPGICTVINLSNVTGFSKKQQGETQISDYLELPSSRKRDVLVLGIDKARSITSQVILISTQITPSVEEIDVYRFFLIAT